MNIENYIILDMLLNIKKDLLSGKELHSVIHDGFSQKSEKFDIDSFHLGVLFVLASFKKDKSIDIINSYIIELTNI